MLEVRGLHAYYGDLQALENVNVRIDEGEIVTIVGANAAGKSTLINAISGLVPRVTGSIVYEGQEILGQPAYRIAEIGIVQVPEGRRLFPFMTVLENLEMGAYHPRARAHKDETLRRVFELFPVLADRKRQLAGSLSGGEQQMCAIARGLMARPRLLMLDEPSLGLAPLFVKRVFEVIQEINRSGTTVLLVEQNVSMALQVAQRAYVLENGRVVLHGPAAELRENDEVRRAYLGI